MREMTWTTIFRDGSSPSPFASHPLPIKNPWSIPWCYTTELQVIAKARVIRSLHVLEATSTHIGDDSGLEISLVLDVGGFKPGQTPLPLWCLDDCFPPREILLSRSTEKRLQAGVSISPRVGLKPESPPCERTCRANPPSEDTSLQHVSRPGQPSHLLLPVE